VDWKPDYHSGHGTEDEGTSELSKHQTVAYQLVSVYLTDMPHCVSMLQMKINILVRYIFTSCKPVKIRRILTTAWHQAPSSSS
jgi:hypothetical protein